jgi:hypothetical protein
LKWSFGRRLTHIGSYEYPLRELVIVQISVEHSEILDLGKAIQVGCDGVVAHEWTVHQWVSSRSYSKSGNILMFPNIVISASLLVDVVAFKATVGRVFFILAPADSFSFKQANDRLTR